MVKTVICGLALAALSAPLSAESRMVRFDDLNLAKPAGLEQLERRIDAAARRVCGVTAARQAGLGEFIRSRQCVAQAKANAARQLAALDAPETRGG